MAKVLITGGGGFLGSHLADLLIAQGHEIIALDMAPLTKVKHLKDNPKFRYIEADVLDRDVVDSLVRRVDVVYHLAAVVGVEHYVGDPYKVLNVNVNGLQRVLHAAQLYEKRLVFSSTSEVYGRNPKVPWKEDDDRVLGSTQIDRWCYSTSKAIGEHFCFAFHKKFDLPVVVVRFFNVYGPRLDRADVGRVISIFAGQALRGEDVTVIGDGKQTRAFTYVSDACRALAAAGFEPRAVGKAINIGTDKETTVLEIAERMAKIAGKGSRVKFVKQEEIYGSSYEDIPRRVPDITLQREILKVEPKVGLDEGLRETLAWFRTQMG
ncbi:SDR family NAD(P)-dependent oxidoreductase [bacterium]|nr:SDR family NAD(P)-dependent oxidoreductase [bacterium]